MHMLRDTYADLATGYFNVPREVLTIHAQYGDWELAKHRIWPDGRRRVTVRRRLRPGDPPAPLPSPRRCPWAEPHASRRPASWRAPSAPVGRGMMPRVSSWCGTTYQHSPHWTQP